MRTQQPLRVDCTERNTWRAAGTTPSRTRQHRHATRSSTKSWAKSLISYRTRPELSRRSPAAVFLCACGCAHVSVCAVGSVVCCCACDGCAAAAAGSRPNAHWAVLCCSEPHGVCRLLHRSQKVLDQKFLRIPEQERRCALHCASAQQGVSYKSRAAYRVRVRVGTNKEFTAQNELEKALALPEVVQVRFR